MSTRVDEALGLLELLPLRRRRLDTLSGGEMQRVAIAAALALRPHILVLDEPTSQLDPHSAEEVLSALLNLNQRLKLTVVLAEHRLERVLPHIGQIIYLSADYLTGLSGEPRQVLGKVSLNPPMVTLGKALGWQPLPLTIEEAIERGRGSPERLPGVEIPQQPAEISDDHTPAYLHASDVQVSFGTAHVLRGVSLSLFPGQITVLMGPNGAGKTTLLRALIGLTPLKAGNVTLAGQDIAGRSVADICQQVGYLPQDPNALLFADTVLEELLITLRNHQIEAADAGINPQSLLERLDLVEKAGSYPRDLSTGERQRVALGAVLVTRPAALLLDEPTRGLDYDAKLTLLRLLRIWRDEGMAILLVTHDVELAAQAADRIVLLDDGVITADGSPNDILSSSAIFAPQIARIFPDRGWLTVRDVIGDANGG